MNRHHRILIIEDNMDIAENISDCLAQEGFITDFSMDGIGGIHLALTQTYEVIILDLMLPGMDGLSLCRQLRSRPGPRVPVLMLTARDTLADKLKGFDAGADDYLVKPFEMDELIARVKALCLRKGAGNGQTLAVEDLVLETGPRRVRRAGRFIDLTPACFRLLVCLMEHHPNIVEKAELGFRLWGDQPPDSDGLKSHVYLLRNQIDKGFHQKLIHTVHGIGYRIGKKNA